MTIKNKTVLLIEDDCDQQKMYGTLFKHAGYQFLQALRGEEGIDVAIKEKPDLILLDILMNGINGIEALELLKKNKITAKIPVVILTNFTKEETLKKAVKLGAEEIIIKTDIVPKELLERVEKKYLT